MPFERYIADDHRVDNTRDYTYYSQEDLYDNDNCHDLGPTCYDNYHPRTTVPLQIPRYMRNGLPVLTPGGGAEVLPASFLGGTPDSLASSWFANNGFAPFHSSLIPSQVASVSAHTASHRAFSPHDLQRFTPSNPLRFTASVGPRQQPLPEPLPSFEGATNHIPNPASSSRSAGTSNAPCSTIVSDSAPPVLITPPSALGLPVYSASGFDVLSILSRVSNRPNPTIQLGPVDLSCSFVVVDVRRYDSPIVYASPTFCHLTGYSEQEILGRNCRFLQSPNGHVVKGEPRRFVSQEAVSYMQKSLSSSKECQTTLINYRKDGQAFINLISVIPLRGGVHNLPEEADEIAYHIGFQADLTEQPTRILDKLRDRNYNPVSNLPISRGLPTMSHGLIQLAQSQSMTNIGPKVGRHGQMMSVAVSKELRNLLTDKTFTDSVSISTGTNMSNLAGSSAEQGNNATVPLTAFVTPPANSTTMNRPSAGSNTMAGSIPISLSPALSLLLLEFLPDFVLVLSLKGAFLYVAPSIRLVLGYEPEDLVGKSISDICHPADLVPLMRELKEGSVSGLSASGTGDVGSSTGASPNLTPKSVDLLFRALPKTFTGSPIKRVGHTSEHDEFQSSLTSSVSAVQSSAPSSDETPPSYVWLECRGRLHVEPGKGRKAIILSGRARWMPVVRWGSISKTGGVRNVLRHEGGSRMAAGSSTHEAAGALSIDAMEFWALLSAQGTFLVASASVRDVLGWGNTEIIGRNIWAMVSDDRSGIRERIEAELSKLDPPETKNNADPPPTTVGTSLVHKDLHVVPIRLVFYRTPRSYNHAPPMTSSIGVTSTPLINPLNNPLCPIVCRATVLSNSERQSEHDTVQFDLNCDRTPSRRQIQKEMGDKANDPESSIHPSGVSLFEELETTRGTSWQYELQQLRFANQRLYEELKVLEEACATREAETGTASSSSTMEGGHVPGVPSVQQIPPSSFTSEFTIRQQTQLQYTSLTHSTHPTSISSFRLPNTLHEQDLPPSEWSSLAGANGQAPNPRKRSWHSEDGPST